MRSIVELDGETRVVGVIGWPVRHSLSPAMQNAAISALGLNWIYVPYEVSPTRLEEALDGMRALGITGLNVTVPHKQGVAELVDELGETARALGAVNTIWNKDGFLFGYNTDGDGFLRALRESGETVEGKRAALIGAGGSGRAVAYALARDGVSALTIVNRTVQRGLEVADLVREHVPVDVSAVALNSAEAEAAIREADIIVDSTPCGMYPDVDAPAVIPGDWLREGQCVCDLVYTPRETSLLKLARARNARPLGGTGMLVYQGAIALERWTGMAAPVDVMKDALLVALQERERPDKQ